MGGFFVWLKTMVLGACVVEGGRVRGVGPGSVMYRLLSYQALVLVCEWVCVFFLLSSLVCIYSL